MWPYSKNTQGDWGHTPIIHKGSGAIHQEYTRGEGHTPRIHKGCGAIHEEYTRGVGHTPIIQGRGAIQEEYTRGVGPYSKNTQGERGHT